MGRKIVPHVVIATAALVFVVVGPFISPSFVGGITDAMAAMATDPPIWVGAFVAGLLLSRYRYFVLAVVVVSAVVLPYVHFAVLENQRLMGITRSADVHLAMGVLRFLTIVLLAHLVNIPRVMMAGSKEATASGDRRGERDSSGT